MSDVQRGRMAVDGISRDIYWTQAERRIVVAAANGLTIPETARLFFISPETVKTQRKRLQRRWDARTITHLVAIAFRSCLLDADEIAGGPIPLVLGSRATTTS
jgi:DNA-binding CsgD family transcriptional regulator